MELVRGFISGATALAIGEFTIGGALRFANPGMRRLLGEGADPARLVSPCIAELAAQGRREGAPVYRGLLHFGDLRCAAHSLRGEVWRLDDALLVLAEADVVELEWILSEVSALNSEITNLQRSLVSEHRALERSLAELRATQTMLVHSEKMNALGQLAAGMAHEINNPLAFIRSNVHTLGESIERLLTTYQALDDLIDHEGNGDLKSAAMKLREEVDLGFLREDTGDLVKGTLGGLSRVQKIVADLRAFSRLDQAEVETVVVLDLLAGALAIAGPMLKKAEMQVEVRSSELPKVRCMPAELSQVFLNLVINAVQAVACRARGEGLLSIRARGEGDAVVLEFEDNGVGMTPEVLARAFDPFFTTKPVGEGTGLGLTISYKIIVDRHGGTISARSTPGAGSTFTITLPTGVGR